MCPVLLVTDDQHGINILGCQQGACSWLDETLRMQDNVPELHWRGFFALKSRSLFSKYELT
jgi:hypothetical protein